MSRAATRLAVVSAFLCLAFTATASAQEFKKSYNLGEGGRIRITNVSGDIYITGSNVESVIVTGTKEGRDRDSVEVEDLSSGNTVEVRVRYFECRRCNASVRFDVQVPRSMKVELDRVSTASGNIEVSGVKGNINVKTASGDVTVKDSSGSITASSASGNVRVDNVAGEVSARTASGDVDAEITRLEGTNNMEFSSASGDVSVRLPASLDADVEMSTHSGSLETDFPIQVSEIHHGDGRRARGRIGNGSRTLRITSASGDVRLKRY
jgi:DUF4097 and DUF4098 domain-containing protein YvlB